MQVPVTDALAYASQKIFDFLDGKVRIKGGTANLQFAVLGVRASTINDNAALTWALGSAAEDGFPSAVHQSIISIADLSGQLGSTPRSQPDLTHIKERDVDWIIVFVLRGDDANG